MKLDTLTNQVVVDPADLETAGDDVYSAVRALLLSEEPKQIADDLGITLKTVQAYNSAIDKLSREDLTELLLDLSLCPLHQIDYAICFDEGTPECNVIRIIHPDHDT